MTRPYGLLRCGFPYVKTLGMRRLTNFPIDVALGKDDRIYVLCRADNASLIRRYSYADEDLGSIGGVGFAEAKALLPESDDMEQTRGYAGRTVALTNGTALYWRLKALRKGLPHLRTGESRYRATSLLERFNREIRVRERMGSAWTVHNLLVLLQARGVLT